MVDPTRASRFAGTVPVREPDIEALEVYLRTNLDGFNAPLQIRQFRGGQSNPTYLLETPDRCYVLRRRPAGVFEHAGHAVDREYRVLRALQGSGVPVPSALHLCQDLSVIGSPFYVMDFVDGRLFWDLELPGLGPGERAAIYDAMNATLAHLHTLDAASLGLSDYGRPEGYMARQVKRWTREYRDKAPEPMPAMDLLAEWLADHLPADQSSLIHGDYRLDNIILHPTEPRILAVLDWELSTLGHPIADLAGHMLAWHLKAGTLAGLAGEDLAKLGIPDEKSYVRRYIDRTGYEAAEDLAPFLAFAAFRIAAILIGVAKRGEDGTATNTAARDFGIAARDVAELGAEFIRGRL
jgi:aminoglycoside phosphotransferase (APT) family kinase protein